MFGNTRQDPSITDEVKALHKLTGNSGRWVKYKLPEESLEPVRKVAGRGRMTHNTYTLPWEEGYGLLPITARDAYTAAMDREREKFNAAVDAFAESYPMWIDEAKKMHNGTFNESDYPPQSEIKESFKWSQVVYPMPAASQFDNHLRTLYGGALEENVTARVEQAVKEMWDRLIAPVKAMADKLASPDAIFRDSLVENIKEVAELIPVLNLTGSAELSAAAAQIKDRLSRLNPETLRVNKVMRKATAEAAAKIVSQFGSFGNRKFA